MRYDRCARLLSLFNGQRESDKHDRPTERAARIQGTTASSPKDQEPYLSIARQLNVDGVPVVWLGMGKVPDELNDLP
jgi:hypothetical protein